MLAEADTQQGLPFNFSSALVRASIVSDVQQKHKGNPRIIGRELSISRIVFTCLPHVERLKATDRSKYIYFTCGSEPI